MAGTLTPITTGRTIKDLVTLASAATVGGDNWVNTGKELLYITNSGSGDITLTVAFGPSAVVDGVAPANRTYTIPHTGLHPQIIGPFPTSAYNDASQLVQLTYSGVTSVTVAVILPGQ